MRKLQNWRSELQAALRRMAPAPDSAGFTLVEVLVALVVLTVGLLALGNVISFSARTGTDSYVQTIAHIQALDMGERMWLNLQDPDATAVVQAWTDAHEESLPGWEGAVVAEDAASGLYRISVEARGVSYEYDVRVLIHEDS